MVISLQSLGIIDVVDKTDFPSYCFNKGLGHMSWVSIYSKHVLTASMSSGVDLQVVLHQCRIQAIQWWIGPSKWVHDYVECNFVLGCSFMGCRNIMSNSPIMNLCCEGQMLTSFIDINDMPIRNSMSRSLKSKACMCRMMLSRFVPFG